MSTQVASQPSSPETRHGLGPLESNEIVIGLALGSPRENPLPLLPHEPFDNYALPSLLQHEGQEFGFSDPVSYPSQSIPPTQPARTVQSNSGIKRSGSKWKNLGGLFSRKTSSAPSFDGQPFYMLDGPNRQEWGKPLRTPASPEELSAPRLLRRMPTPPESQSHMIDLAEPVHESGPRAMLRRASTRRKGIRKRARAHTGASSESTRGSPPGARLEDRRILEEPADPSTWLKVDDKGNVKQEAGASSFPGASSLLEIEIPSVELERYSVMFGDLLQPKSNSSLPSPLSRRQSRRRSQLREIKALSPGKENRVKAVAGYSPLSSNPPFSSSPPLSSNPPRPVHTRKDSSSSTASKSSTKSGNYGLFPPPAPPQKRNTAHKPLPKPSPLSRSVTAPNAAPTSPPRPTIQMSKSQDVHQLMILARGADASSPPKEESPPRPSAHSRQTSSFDPSHISASSSQANFVECEDHSAKHDFSPPSTTDGTGEETSINRAFPVRKSSMKAPQPPVTLRVPSPVAPSKAPIARPAIDSISSEGEVSIARQVSISRRQRNLVPIVPQVARQPMQVKLVNSCSTPALRKSHHLTFEDIVEKC